MVWTPVSLVPSAAGKTASMVKQAMHPASPERCKGGRPRLGDQPDFFERFASVLPALRDGEISKGEAARRLGISHRSLNRYLEPQELFISN